MKNWKRLISLFVLLSCILLSIFQCNRQIKKNQESELVDNLRAVSKQSAKTIENEIESEQARLLAMAAEIGALEDNGEDIDAILALMATMNQNSGFKRVGFVDTDGIAHTTDGYVRNLSFRSFYKRSMQGELVLTDTLNDSIGATEPINVFSAPVYQADETICGVVFATYRNDDFRQLFDMDGFDTTGSNCIVNANSEVIAATKNLPFDASKENLFDYMESLGSAAQQNMTEYYQNIAGSGSSDAYYQKISKMGSYYVYYEEIGMKDFSDPWYLVTLVNETTVDGEVSTMMGTITNMLLEIGFLIVLAFVLFLFDSGRAERKQHRELERIAFIDPMTGGDNYARFVDKVSRLNRVGFIVSMDLHAFKMINSVCGIERGDEILRSVYSWIRDIIDPEDIVAHVNADRYILFFPRCEREMVIEKITLINQKIVHETKQSGVPQVSAYFGITWYERGEAVEKALSEANFARENVHEKKKEFYSFFDQAATNQILTDKRMEDNFEDAMLDGEFEVWYQPKISPKTNAIVGAEALIRWRKPDGTLIPPGMFIPLFEGNGMIRLLDEYVFRETCKEQKRLLDKGVHVIPVSVNLSRASIYSMNLVERYKQITDEIGISPKLVPIEVTESAAVDENFMQNIADQFYKMGFPLHMDDFGSGYSSLASLNRMHFDALKLDKSLIDYIGNFGGDQLIKHTIALAKDLGMHVTAEGVEDEQQVSFLEQQSCDSIQGFFYSRPVPRKQFEEMLARITTAA